MVLQSVIWWKVIIIHINIRSILPEFNNLKMHTTKLNWKSWLNENKSDEVVEIDVYKLIRWDRWQAPSDDLIIVVK